MIEIVCNVLGPKIHWHLDASQSSKPEDLIKLVFTTAAFSTFSEREAYETIRASLRRENVSWAEPAPDAWRLQLEGLAGIADQGQAIPWLHGIVTLKPEFKSEVLSPGPPKVGEGKFTFYISPKTASEFSVRTPGTENTTRSHVFVSYSHADKKWRDRVRVHLRPLEKQGILELFDDSKIDPGAHWREEIAAALDRARVAILLVSADFIASDFIAEDELPPLLKKAESGGATIIPVIVSPCGFSREKRLSRYQSVNKPEEPLEGLTYSESEQVLAKLAEAVENVLYHSNRERRGRASKGPPALGEPKASLQSEAAKELLQLIENEPDSDKRGLTEILDSPEPGQTFFLPGLRDSGSPLKMKSRLFREGVAELVSREWLYPPEDTGKTRLYEFRSL